MDFPGRYTPGLFDTAPCTPHNRACLYATPHRAMTTPKPAPAPEDARALLMECGLLLASFRWKLRSAGYPFAEPPGLARMITRLDNHCFPDFNSKIGTVKPAQIAQSNDDPF